MESSLHIYTSLEAALAKHAYTTLLLDAYGVFWQGNAKGAFPGAQEVMERLFASGKKIAIISNSTQLSQNEIKKYASAGFIQGKHFHALITSGDLAKKVFSSRKLPFSTPNKKYILFFPEHPRYSSPASLFEESPFQETSDLLEADFIYLNVPHIGGEDQEDREAFSHMLERFIHSKKPMVCANPDAFSHEGLKSRLVVRQGSVAALYEKMGGAVEYLGKPFPQIYTLALDRLSLGPVCKEDILMVGDTPETDIRGAHSFGIHSALITHTGVMGERTLIKGFKKAIQDLPVADSPQFLVERFSSYAI